MSPIPRIDWRERWRRAWLRLLPAYWIFLFCVMHFPKARLPGVVPAEDKVAHLLAYGLLAFLLWKFAEALRRGPVDAGFRWRALLLLSAYAVIDEYLQKFVGRSASVGDWLADVVGAATMIAFLDWRRRAAAPPKAQAAPPKA